MSYQRKPTFNYSHLLFSFTTNHVSPGHGDGSSENNSDIFYLCVFIWAELCKSPRDVDMWGVFKMSRFRRAWMSLNFDKEYLFGFETLVFATSGIVSMHNQLVTPQRESKT